MKLSSLLTYKTGKLTKDSNGVMTFSLYFRNSLGKILHIIVSGVIDGDDIFAARAIYKIQHLGINDSGGAFKEIHQGEDILKTISEFIDEGWVPRYLYELKQEAPFEELMESLNTAVSNYSASEQSEVDGFWFYTRISESLKYYESAKTALVDFKRELED